MLLMLVSLVRAQDVKVVKEIVVNGNVRVSKEAILSSMSTKVGSTYNEAALDTDRQTLFDLGFFSSVDVRGVPLENGNSWQVIVQVAEYPVIKEVKISGNTVVSSDDIRKVISKNYQEGKVFNSRDARSSADAIEKLYFDRGYYVQVPTFGPEADSPSTLDITVIEEKVGYVSVQGNKFTKDWVMRRLIKTRSGQIFKISKWQNDIRRVANTQWFDPSSIRTTQDTDRELGNIDLTLDLKEQRTGSFNVGVQVDPQSSLAGIIRYTQGNLGGTGQTVSVNFLQATSGGGPSVSLDYTNPFIDNQDTVLNASIYSKVLYRFANNLFGGGGSGIASTSSYDERHTGGTIGFTRPTSDYTSVGISAKFEKVTTENLNNLNDQETTPNDPTDDQSTNNFIQQDGTVGILGFRTTVNHRDIDLDPSRGYFLQLSLEPGYADITQVGGLTTNQNILGTHPFLRTTADYRFYWTPDKPRGKDLDAPKRVIAFRARVGDVQGTIPFFEQYFVGGSDTLRGYLDDRFWGKYELLTNLELRYPIQKSFSLIGFVDYGDAWGGYTTIQNFTQDSSLRMHLGYGPGISFKTPLGNIQLFLGFNENGGTQTHFLIGNSF
jgi:outer membrane protein insertion porin family